MRIAALLDTTEISGPGRQLAALATQLKRAGIQLRVVTFHRDGRARSPYLDYLESADIPYTVIADDGPLDVALVRRLRRTLLQWRPDLVQTHGYKPTALAFALRAMRAPWPWIAFSHGATAENPKVEFYHWLERRLLGAADRVVVMSRQQGDGLARLGDKVRVVFNAAIPLPSDDGVQHASGNGAADFDAGTPLIGVVGRLSPEKGVDIFLRACEILVRRRVEFSAIVVGDGPEWRNLEQLRDTLDLERHVRFTGLVAAVQAMYARLQLLVIPSRSEGLPNVLLEALRLDVPVVATMVGAIPDVLEASGAGIMVPPRDPAALADAIVRGLTLKSDPASRQARREVTRRFSLERRMQAHMQLYAEVLGSRVTELAS